MSPTAANVALRALGACVEGAWWYDEGHRCVVELCERDGRLSLCMKPLVAHLGAKIPSGMYASYAKGTTFASAKLSMDCHFLALQRSDVEVEIAVLREPQHRFNIMCKRSARILGLVWSAKIAYLKSFTEYLVLITTGGLEQYKVTQTKCKFHRLVTHSIYQYWYNSTGNLLVLNTGEKANEFRPYILEGAIITKCPKLITRLQYQDVIYIATLYKTQYIIHSTVNQLLLYRVEAGCDTRCVRAMALPFPPEAKLQFAVVDDVLVAYSSTFGVTCYYDIALDMNSSLLPPLPLETPSTGAWQFYPPNFAFSMENSTWAIIDLELFAITRCAGRSTDVVMPFLLRRLNASAAKTCILESLVTRMVEGAHVDELTSYFMMLHRIYQAAVLDRSTNDISTQAPNASTNTATKPVDLIDLREPKHNQLVLLQQECLVHLWQPLFLRLSPQYFHLYFSSYLHTLQSCNILIDPNLIVLYIQVIVKRQVYHEGLPLLATQSDSSIVAQELEKHITSYRPYFQIALDIYHRLGIVDQVLRMLLDDGNVRGAWYMWVVYVIQVTMAFRLALRYFHKHDKLPLLCTPLWFFEKVVIAVTSAPSMCWQWFNGLYLLLVAYAPESLNSGSLATMYNQPFPSSLFHNKEMGRTMAMKFGFTDINHIYN